MNETEGTTSARDRSCEGSYYAEACQENGIQGCLSETARADGRILSIGRGSTSFLGIHNN